MKIIHNHPSLFLVMVSLVCGGIHAQDLTPSAAATAPAAGVTLKSHTELIEEFGLPTLTEGPPVTFAEALSAADKHNPSLAAMRVSIESAQAKVKTAWGGVLPVINGKLDYTVRDHEDSINLTESMSPLFDAMGIAPPETADTVIVNQQDARGVIEATMPIFNFQNWVRIRVARDGVDLSQLNVEAMRQQLYLNVAEAYFSAMMSRKLIDVQLTSLASLVNHLSVANARFNAGAGLRIDVIRAETDVETAKQQIISANLFYDNTRDALATLTGIAGLPTPSDDPKMTVPEGDDQTLEKEAISTRFDVKASAATVEMNRRALREARSELMPTINAYWQGGYQITDTADLASSDKSRMLALFTLTVPLYNHYRYGRISSSRAALKESEFQKDDLVAKVSMSVRKARRDYESSLSTVTVAEKRSALSKEALTLTQAAYNGGSGSSLDVTDATRTALDADVNLTTKILESQLALLKFLYAIGNDLETVGK